jgi:hypothetical protein
MNDTPQATASDWTRFQPWRPWVEYGFWIALFLVNAGANSITVSMDVRRVHVAVDQWEPAVWEVSSNLVSLLLVPLVVWFTRRVPLHLDTWRRALPLHLLASIAWSALHVLGMVAMRKAIYAMQGAQYDFGDWPREFFYEYLKDVRSFAGGVATIEVYRWFLRRLQGEASLLASADDAPAPASGERPERFLVRKLGKEFLIAANEVESAQAAGNYVNLHLRGRDYPLRSTMSAVEQMLDPARFVRVHRSWIVNLDAIAEIEPLDTGDARVRLRDGRVLPCSRTYRDALRPRAVA